jgi:hypothetical protein
MSDVDPIQRFFPSKPETVGLGGPKGAPYWNVLALMKVTETEEASRSPAAVAMFLTNFKALAPRKPKPNPFGDDAFVYERGVKREEEGGGLSDHTIEQIVSLTNEQVAGLYISEEWAAWIRDARLQGCTSAIEVDKSYRWGPFRFGVPFQAKAQKPDGQYLWY